MKWQLNVFSCVLQNTHELRVHKLVVKVAGWKEVSPLSVDKVGVYFREARPEIDKSSAIVGFFVTTADLEQ